MILLWKYTLLYFLILHSAIEHEGTILSLDQKSSDATSTINDTPQLSCTEEDEIEEEAEEENSDKTIAGIQLSTEAVLAPKTDDVEEDVDLSLWFAADKGKYRDMLYVEGGREGSGVYAL